MTFSSEMETQNTVSGLAGGKSFRAETTLNAGNRQAQVKFIVLLKQYELCHAYFIISWNTGFGYYCYTSRSIQCITSLDDFHYNWNSFR